MHKPKRRFYGCCLVVEDAAHLKTLLTNHGHDAVRHKEGSLILFLCQNSGVVLWDTKGDSDNKTCCPCGQTQPHMRMLGNKETIVRGIVMHHKELMPTITAQAAFARLGSSYLYEMYGWEE